MKNGKSDKWYAPEVIKGEYESGRNYKAGIGTRGLYEQSRINQRFISGDQWHGVQAGDKKAMVRYNVIRRIGEYKTAMVDGSALAVCFSAEGVPCTKEMREKITEQRDAYRRSNFDAAVRPEEAGGVSEAERINLMMDRLSAYYKTTAERLKFDEIKSKALKRAFVTGTGILYTYWDPAVKTGQFADDNKSEPITGDIRCEVLDVENVYFGDPTLDDVQDQPYILIVQRRRVDELQREARRYNRPTDEVNAIKADRDTAYMAGDASADEPPESRKATVITKLYKEYNKDGGWTIKAVRVTEGVTIRPEWDIGVKMYPIAKMSWADTPNSVYGDSEVTHLIPNQIAINRAITSAADAVMKMGMPIMLVDTDVVQGEVTNDPGQIIYVAGMPADNPVRYVSPQNFTPQFDQITGSMMSNTMSCAGANDAALGDMRPENTSAIMALREAATMPLQLMKNRFYAFIEENARIWMDFWSHMYGRRKLKMVDGDDGVWYYPFDASACKDLVINTRVDVGPANLWSEITCLQTLDALFKARIIDAVQYLERLPKGSIPEQSALIREVKDKVQPAPTEGDVPDMGGAPTAAPAPDGGMDPAAIIGMLSPDYQDKYNQLPPEAQAQVLAQMQGGM